MWSNGSHQNQAARMQAELEEMRRKVAAFGERLGSQAAEAGREHVGLMRSAYDRAHHEAAHRAEEAADKARTQVASHPLSTIAGAFVLGIALGAIMGRR